MSAADLLFPAAFLLGESAVWLPESRQLALVDIDAGDVHLLDPSHPLKSQRLALGGWVSAVMPAAGGRLLVAAERGLGLLDPATGAFAISAAPDEHLLAHRYNDAKPDRQGRLVIGTMARQAPRSPTGRLYRFDAGPRTLLAEGLKTPNAICFSPDGRWLYSCDTAEGVIWRQPWDPETGTPGPRSLLAAKEIAPGSPDGATVDADGCLWSARYNGGCIARITPDGRLDRLVQLPVRQVTSIAFGGAGMATAFVTTARQNLAAEALSTQPLAGSVFAFDPGTTGIAETVWAGSLPAGPDHHQETTGTTGA